MQASILAYLPQRIRQSFDLVTKSDSALNMSSSSASVADQKSSGDRASKKTKKKSKVKVPAKGPVIEPLSEIQSDETRAWNFLRRSEEEIQKIPMKEALAETADDLMAVLVFANVKALEKCVLSATAVIWDHILRSFLLHAKKSSLPVVNCLLEKKKTDIIWAKKVKESDERRQAMKKRQRELLKKKLAALGKSKIKIASSSSSSSEDNGLSRDDMRYLAKSIPVLYYCDPLLGQSFYDLCEESFEAEGMNFQATLDPHNAFLQFLHVSRIDLSQVPLVTTPANLPRSESIQRELADLKERNFVLRKNQLTVFVGDVSADGESGHKLRLFGKDILLRGEKKHWPEGGNFTGLPQDSGVICYSDGIVESCFNKILMVRNGRKTERAMNITKLDDGFLPGLGPITQCAKWIANVNPAERMAFTGAGISAESGVPTYRDPGGLWEIYNPEEVNYISSRKTISIL